MEYPYTSLNQEERKQDIRIHYMDSIIDIIAVAFFVGIVGITYQLTGLVAAERELGMSQLIDCMIPKTDHWQPQAARFLAAHLALDLIYAPGWIIMAFVLAVGVFTNTSASIQIIFHLLAGLSLSSFALFGASFFRKAQLSGITAVIVCLLLGIISQLVPVNTDGGIIILSLLFPPMNYVYFTKIMASWEKHNLSMNLIKSAPQDFLSLPGIILWFFTIIQIVVYPVLGALVERLLFGTRSQNRRIALAPGSPTAIVISDFRKDFKPNWFYRKIVPILGSRRYPIRAVDNLNLNVVSGEIMVLLGANGSGKSTTLEAVSGLSKITSGEITLNYREGSNGFGLCPQKNVLWESLTVKEHVKIFSGLKAGKKPDEIGQLYDLITACDLEHKSESRSKNLSGGQKRKLQLAMMFTGGSSICCVDEVSSGLDPISRRKIWEILLAERGRRTILLTTHFLDEADILADHIAILSKGTLKTQGSSVELKNKLGSGYKFHINHMPASAITHYPLGVEYDKHEYSVADSSQAADFVMQLQKKGIEEYCVSGPTLEDVFLKVAEEAQASSEPPLEYFGPGDIKDSKGGLSVNQAPHLLTGKRIDMRLQTWILLCKRAIILRRNFVPYVAAFVVPIVATGLVTLFLKNFNRPGCSGPGTIPMANSESLLSRKNAQIVLGPPNKISLPILKEFLASLSGASITDDTSTEFENNIYTVNTIQEFRSHITTKFHDVAPGGIFLGDDISPPTFAWLAEDGMSLPIILQNAMDNLLMNFSITSQYQVFDVPLPSNFGDALQLTVYFGLAMAVYPAFFSLYPTMERLHHIRTLHYSNGVRNLPLWLAYLLFDSSIVLALSGLIVAIFSAASNTWYHTEYLFIVFFFYGLSATLLSYTVSLVATSQLSSFAFAAGGQA